MKSIWRFSGPDQNHPPVEMRFIDMFMTTLGALVFLALTLVFLLPTTAKEEAQRFDKNVVKQWLSVLIIADRCGDASLDMYVRYEGSLYDWDSGKITGRSASKFDIIHPPKKEMLAGTSYAFLGQDLPNAEPFHQAANVDELSRNELRAMFFFGLGAGEPFSAYVAAVSPATLHNISCTIRPVFLAWNDVQVGETVILTEHRPFAWLQRFSIALEGGLSAPAPLTDAKFRQELQAFSDEQSQILCSTRGRCGTEDAHLFKLRASAPPPTTDDREIGPSLAELFRSGRYEEARDVLNTRSVDRLNPVELVFRAAVYQRLGETDVVPAAVSAALERHPDLSVEAAMNDPLYVGDRDLIAEMMRMSGFPECASERVIQSYHQPVRLPDCVTIEDGLEERTVPLAPGASVRDELLAQGVSEEDARAIDAEIGRNFAPNPGKNLELRVYFDNDDTNRSQPVQIAIFESDQYIGAVALSDNGTYDAIGPDGGFTLDDAPP